MVRAEVSTKAETDLNGDVLQSTSYQRIEDGRQRSDQRLHEQVLPTHAIFVSHHRVSWGVREPVQTGESWDPIEKHYELDKHTERTAR